MASGDKETKTVVDPWSGMPKFVKDAFKDDVAFRNALLGDALGSDPRKILKMNKEEKAAYKAFLGGADKATDVGNTAVNDLLKKNFGLDYTDAVVRTTLRDMDRKAERDKVTREARQAAVGGTSGSRSAVEDAVAKSLHNQDRSAMAAKLRDSAQRFDFDTFMDRTKTLDDMADTGLGRSVAVFDLMNKYGEKERGIDQSRKDSSRSNLTWLMDLFTGSQNKGAVPVGQTQTTTTPGNSALQNILGAGTSLAGAWLSSDERVKEDISDPEGSALEKIKKLSSKEYKYKDGHGHTKGRTTGLMAQDIEEAGITGAVAEIDGVKRVDPYPILATVVDAVAELSQQNRVA